MAGLFECRFAEAQGDGRSVIVRGQVKSGRLADGLQLQIVLNSGFAVQLPISAIQGDDLLVVDCDDQEGVDMFMDLAIAGECFELVKEAG
ncbi:hypothetical protein HNQ59_003267 [Chitinivorax tropicus]|uniref:PilZ domain-containing protein n=1 Tax=Chitinivorax tropicus TaxID=714531 RepID=A0A840MSA5_9PROT|nr:hypothetical protein [Chitinivorax tropicus]MBB5019959.1 hypothetical protein [Chitinivorax tropicus]